MAKIYAPVMIYADPVTKLKPEGKAHLVRKIMDMSDGQELWKVHFDEDDSIFFDRIIDAQQVVRTDE